MSKFIEVTVQVPVSQALDAAENYLDDMLDSECRDQVVFDSVARADYKRVAKQLSESPKFLKSFKKVFADVALDVVGLNYIECGKIPGLSKLIKDAEKVAATKRVETVSDVEQAIKLLKKEGYCVAKSV